MPLKVRAKAKDRGRVRTKERVVARTEKAEVRAVVGSQRAEAKVALRAAREMPKPSRNIATSTTTERVQREGLQLLS